ncbi:hypothetical protein [Azospirillum canadense]|uniref:hypothetical protein n=1 Tax=Azospirillum canadense TaxID=403962 RepID=UPI002225EAD0|nr:hypothetical protein [Azospirillum canadense]MCW2242250.1 hypothetical protein [Azospirillum canadense]
MSSSDAHDLDDSVFREHAPRIVADTIVADKIVNGSISGLRLPSCEQPTVVPNTVTAGRLVIGEITQEMLDKARIADPNDSLHGVTDCGIPGHRVETHDCLLRAPRPGELIVDGAITATTITPGTINIGNATVNGVKIDPARFSVDTISGGTIVAPAAEIVDGAITDARIVPGVEIEGGKIVVGSLRTDGPLPLYKPEDIASTTVTLKSGHRIVQRGNRIDIERPLLDERIKAGSPPDGLSHEDWGIIHAAAEMHSNRSWRGFGGVHPELAATMRAMPHPPFVTDTEWRDLAHTVEKGFLIVDGGSAIKAVKLEAMSVSQSRQDLLQQPTE